MKRKAHGAQKPRHINRIVEVTSTAQRSDSPAQAINQRFLKPFYERKKEHEAQNRRRELSRFNLRTEARRENDYATWWNDLAHGGHRNEQEYDLVPGEKLVADQGIFPRWSRLLHLVSKW